jgi:hypothetical protein
MKAILAAFAGAACLLLDFAATGYGPGIFSGMPAPQNPVTGSILFTAASAFTAMATYSAQGRTELASTWPVRTIII